MSSAGLPQTSEGDRARCPQCGAIYQAHYATCLVDGTLLQPMSIHPPPPRSISTRTAIPAAVVVLLLLAATALYLQSGEGEVASAQPPVERSPPTQQQAPAAPVAPVDLTEAPEEDEPATPTPDAPTVASEGEASIERPATPVRRAPAPPTAAKGGTPNAVAPRPTPRPQPKPTSSEEEGTSLKTEDIKNPFD